MSNLRRLVSVGVWVCVRASLATVTITAAPDIEKALKQAGTLPCPWGRGKTGIKKTCQVGRV